MPKFNKKLASELTSLEEKWYFFFSQMQNLAEIKKVVQTSPEYINHAWQTVQASSWTKNERMQYLEDAMTLMNINSYESKIKREATEATEATQAVIDAKIKELEAKVEEELEKRKQEVLNMGKQQGKAEGKAEGKIEGIEEEKIEIAKNLLSLSIDEEIISKSTGLSIEKIVEI